MSKAFLLALAGASALATTSHAVAAGNPTPSADTAPKTELQEIVVTARRQSEALQDIPVSVQAVSGDALRKLAITQPDQLSSVTPGLNIQMFVPDDPTVELRGVRWVQATGQPAIPFYLNEIAFEPGQILHSLYDVGQIEVLRGPQGTSRGAPSISGAVTITTQKPDLFRYGGYVSGLVGEHGHWNTQGAINVPLIPGKLAVRVAADFENTQGNEARSLNDSQTPTSQLHSGRITFRYEPTDDIKALVMFQHETVLSHLYDQVEGPGSPGVPGLGLPANFNGPAITAKQHLSVEAATTRREGINDSLAINLSWDFLGQELSYNFGWDTNEPGRTVYPQEVANLTPGSETYQVDTGLPNHEDWSELRLSSQRGGGHPVDYDIGLYVDDALGGGVLDEPAFFAPGAFGNPGANPSPFNAPLTRYTVNAHVNFTLKIRNLSAYSDVALHLPYDTELTGGLRFIFDRRPTVIKINSSSAFFGLVNPAVGLGLTCEQIGIATSPVYGAPICDVAIPAAVTPTQSFVKNYTPMIYNISLSHKFTPDILGYVTVGTSWRAGFPAIGVLGLPSQLTFPKAESAISYELGAKTSWGRRLRINADVFQIDYTGQLTQFKGIPYFNSVSGTESATSLSFLWNVDAVVRGAEAEISVQPISHLTLTADVSYSDIQAKGGSVPCNDDANRPISASNVMNFCASKKGKNLNASAPFQATLNGQYTYPLGPYDGYLRFNINEQGHNPNFGTSLTSTAAFTTVDLFGGFTGQHGAWDVGLYAKNVFDAQVVLAKNVIVGPVDQLFGPPGYSEINMNLPREVGLQARYTFK